VHIDRLLEGVTKGGALAAQRGELERAVGSRPADAYDTAMRDEDLALGTMAASALGGSRDPDLALQCFTRVWESGAGTRDQAVEGESGDVSLALQLALLHVEEDGAGDEESKVEALLEGTEDDAPPPGGASRKHGGEEVTEDMAKAVIKDIRSLQRQVRKSQVQGRPVAALLRPAKPLQEGKDRLLGVELLRFAAEGGHVDAQVMLGNLAVSGKLLEWAPKTATSVAGNLVEVRPLFLDTEKKAAAFSEEGISWYKRATEGLAPHPDAWFNLGLLHYEGRMVSKGLKLPRDPAASRECMEQAAALGDSSALYWLGFGALTSEVDGVEEDADTGLARLTAAADLHHPEATYYLAMLRRETGDLEGMRSFLERAVELRHAEAEFCLADCCFHGNDGYQVDAPKAARLYTRAARQRHVSALCCLGACYYHGLGVSRDLHRAFRAYQIAAEEGSVPAMRNLAGMHSAGEGCDKSESAAKYMLKVANEAEQAEAGVP